jgi:hypothetical protein
MNVLMVLSYEFVSTQNQTYKDYLASKISPSLVNVVNGVGYWWVQVGLHNVCFYQHAVHTCLSIRHNRNGRIGIPTAWFLHTITCSKTVCVIDYYQYSPQPLKDSKSQSRGTTERLETSSDKTGSDLMAESLKVTGTRSKEISSASWRRDCGDMKMGAWTCL